MSGWVPGGCPRLLGLERTIYIMTEPYKEGGTAWFLVVQGRRSDFLMAKTRRRLKDEERCCETIFEELLEITTVARPQKVE